MIIFFSSFNLQNKFFDNLCIYFYYIINKFIFNIEKLSAEISETEEQSDNVERFISKVHKYFDLQELTSSVLNDMVKRVYVHAPQTIDGKRIQEIDIVYDLAGILPQTLFEHEETA